MVELCIHIANVFYLGSFLVRDMLWLRALTCVGLLLGVVFFSCQKTPMYGPTAWHLVFLAINGVQIYRLASERRRMTLSKEQARFAEAAFNDLSREQLLTLLTRVTSARPGQFRDLHESCRAQLDADEQILRDLAFGHLTRKELLNLLTRRAWNAFKRRRSTRQSARRFSGSEVPDRSEMGRTQEAITR